ncbi:MAG TPA: T9SS type A sorting domain-containing protein, partial [Bacteroidia bacterium]|nr:T9SS type A sorting domain-containing protein [Bacteroidia bacterium]
TPTALMLVTQEGMCPDSNKLLLTSVGNPSYTHRWIIGTDTLFGVNQQKVFSTSGYHTARLLVLNPLGNCSSEDEVDSILIYAKPAPVAILGDPFIKLGKEYTFKALGPGTSAYTWAVSQTPDFIKANNDSLTIRWDNSLLTATLKLVERNANGCKGDTAYFQLWTLVNSVASPGSNAWRIYPVPAADEITVENVNKGSGEVRLTVYDMQGKRVIEKQFTSPQVTFDISQLKDGIYYMAIESGDTIFREKIVKQSTK